MVEKCHLPVVSGAEHDVVYTVRLAPSGIMFMLCKDGISGDEVEVA